MDLDFVNKIQKCEDDIKLISKLDKFILKKIDIEGLNLSEKDFVDTSIIDIDLVSKLKFKITLLLRLIKMLTTKYNNDINLANKHINQCNNIFKTINNIDIKKLF